MAPPTGTHVQFQLDVTRFNQRLAQFVAASMRSAEQVVFEVASDVLGDTQEGWPVAEVDGGLSRAAWWGPRKVGAASYQIGNPVRYAGVIEFGGYPSPGEKTAPFGPVVLPGDFSINQGVYPRQKPAAPLRRALAKHYGAMTAKMQDAHQQAWGH